MTAASIIQPTEPVPPSDPNAGRTGNRDRRGATWIEEGAPFIPWMALLGIIVWLSTRPGFFGTGNTVAFLPDTVESAIKAYAAAHGHQLTGAYSRYGFQHPGPFYFAWLAPFYRLAGYRPAGLELGTALLHLTLLVGAVVALRLTFGRRLAMVGSALLALWAARYGIHYLFYFWNPLPTAAAMICFLVCLPAASRATRWAAIGATITGSALIQMHAGTAIVVLATGAWPVWRAIRSARQTDTLRRLVIPVLICVAVLWAPVAIDQFHGSGNVTSLARYFVSGKELPSVFLLPEGSTQGHQSLAETIPLTAGAMSLRVDKPGGWAGVDLRRAAEQHGSWADVAIIFALMALVAAGTWLTRPRNPRLALLGGLTLLATAATFVSAARVRGTDFYGYQVHYAVGIGYLLWAVPILMAVDAMRGARRPDRRSPSPGGADRVRGIGGTSADFTHSIPGAAPPAAGRVGENREGVGALAQSTRASAAVAVVICVVAAAVVIGRAPGHITVVPTTWRSPADVVTTAMPDIRAVNVDATDQTLTFDALAAIGSFQRQGIAVGTGSRWRFVVASNQVGLRRHAPTMILAPPTAAVPHALRIGVWRATPKSPPVGVFLRPAT